MLENYKECFKYTLTYFTEDVRLGFVTYRLFRRLARVTPTSSIVLKRGHSFSVGTYNGVR